jgi:nucleotide-binding universal stress UspA family protein
MKTLLVPVEECDGLPSILDTALLVAQTFGSYVEGLHVRPWLVGMAAAGGMAGPMLVENFEKEDQERAEVARRLFTTFMREHGVPAEAEGQTVAAGPRHGWIDDVPPGDDVVGTRGRLFDLIVVGRPARGVGVPRMSTLEAGLFDSGRPLLIAAPRPPSSLGRVVVIAWNGSTETARTVAFAMPFLARAERVVVLCVKEGMVPGPSAADAALHLVRNEVKAEPLDVGAGSRSVGEAILDHAASIGSDLLIKGAYTQSRLRQMIFGGATSHILAEADVPVFMAH